MEYIPNFRLGCYRGRCGLKRFLCFILILAFVFPPLPGRAATLPPPEGMVMKAENANLSLYFNPDDANFAVRNKRTGRTWYSNPPDWQETHRFGMPRYSMASQLLIESMIPGMAMQPSPSQHGSVNRGGMTYESITNGVRVSYYFPDFGLTVPISLILHDTSLEVRFSLDEVIIPEDNPRVLMSVTLAPYFGGGGASCEGFILVPDGSGAVINFNNNRANFAHFDERVYGIDPALLGELRQTHRKQVHLPVFGIENHGESILAVITEGAAAARIRALTYGQFNDMNNAHARFDLFAFTSVQIGSSTGGGPVQSTIRFEFNNPMTTTAAVEFHFLPETGYAAMALAYGNILRQGRERINFGVPPLYVSLFGGFRNRESILGIPINRYIAMTTFSEAEEIVGYLFDAGVDDLVLVLNNWSSDEARNRVQNDVRPAWQLGGMRGLRQLNEAILDRGGSVYLRYDPLYATRRGRGLLPRSNAARGLDGNPLVVHRHRLGMLYRDLRFLPFIMPTIEFIMNLTARFTERLARGFSGTTAPGIYFNSLGNQLYGNYHNRNFLNRVDTVVHLENEIFNANKRFIANSPNAYAIPNASHILDTPVTSSSHSVFCFDVPFYQIAIGGIAPYSVPVVNNSPDPHLSLLKAIETGAGLHFKWVYQDPNRFIYTAYERHFATGFQRWADEAISMYHEHKDVFNEIGSSVLIDHERLSQTVTKSTFLNGRQVIVNFGNDEFHFDGFVIEARGWLVLP